MAQAPDTHDDVYLKPIAPVQPIATLPLTVKIEEPDPNSLIGGLVAKRSFVNTTDRTLCLIEDREFPIYGNLFYPMFKITDEDGNDLEFSVPIQITLAPPDTYRMVAPGATITSDITINGYIFHTGRKKYHLADLVTAFDCHTLVDSFSREKKGQETDDSEAEWTPIQYYALDSGLVTFEYQTNALHRALVRFFQ
jgi:hypothetical protein